MAKRTFAFIAVFAAALSFALSVQAENYDYYWKGGSGNYFTQSMWQLSDGSAAPVPLSSTTNVITAYIDASGSSVNFDYSHLGDGVKSLTIGGGSGAVSVTRYSGNTLTIAPNKFISVLSNGTLTVQNTMFINADGLMSVNGGSLSTTGIEISGTFSYTSGNNFVNANTINLYDGGTLNLAGSGQFRINGASAVLNIQGGNATIDNISYIGVGENGVINQTGGNAAFNNTLAFGWGSGDGTYNLSGGTLTTTKDVGLWCSKSKGFNTFNMTGGTANFNQAGNSFTIGLYQTFPPLQVANVFNLNSGTINATDTFAIQYGGTLFVAKNGEEGGDGVLNAKAITLTNSGNLNMSSGTINVGEGGITSSDGAYTVTLSGGTFGTNGSNWSSALNATISSDAVTFSPDEGKSITWSGVLSGAGGVTKTGAGTLKLTAANTYTGGTTITGGTVAVSTVNSLGTGAVTVNGGTLDASPAGKSKTFANAIAIGENGGTVTVASGDYSSFASISGSGNLTTNGYVHFNGTGGYNGHLTVNNGFARINPGAFGVFDLTINNKSNFNVFNSGTIQIGKLNATTDTCLFGSSASNQYVFEIGAGTTSSDSASYAGYIRGSSNQARNVTVKKVGAGTQTFCRTGYGTAGDTNSIKEVIIDGGKMIINANHSVYNAESTIGYWGSAPITINAGGTLVYDHVWNTSPNTMLTINGGTLTLNKAQYQNAITFNSGTVNGSDELRAGYNGTGVWTVKGGTSTINNKVVLVKSGNHTTFTVNFDSGATLDVKKNITGLNKYIGTNVTFNGTGENPGNILLYTASGVMSGLGSITFNNMNASIAKDGTSFWDYGYFNASSVTLKDSTLTTSRDHSTNGTTFTLDHGTLTANGAVNSYIANVYLKNGSTINGTTDGSTFRTGHQWNSNFYTQYVDGKPENVMNEISADIAMYNTGRTMTFNIADKAPLTVSGRFIPAGSGQYNALVKTGAGTMTLTGQNSHGTTTVSEGTLVLSGNGTLGADAVTVAQNATLEFAHDSNQNVTNAISGAGNVVKSGAGTLTLTQAPGYTGSTTVESGTLALADGGTLYNLSGEGVVSYSANALTLNNSANSTFSGDILGYGTVTKAGTGTLTLTQAPGYTGSTTVQSGTLALADGGTLYNLSGGSLDASGNVTTFIDATDKDLTLSNSELSKFIGSITAGTIEKTGDGTMQIYTGANGQVDAQSLVVSSGRLDMKEYFKGTLDVEAGATLSPGNSVGTLTVDGTYLLDKFGTLLLEVGKNDQGAIVIDQLFVNGNATFAPGSIIDIVLDPSSSLVGGDEFSSVIITANNAESIFDDVQAAIRSYYFTDLTVTRSGNEISLSGRLDPNAVPEPSTWALLILGVAGLAYLRKRVRS